MNISKHLERINKSLTLSEPLTLPQKILCLFILLLGSSFVFEWGYELGLKEAIQKKENELCFIPFSSIAKTEFKNESIVQKDKPYSSI